MNRYRVTRTVVYSAILDAPDADDAHMVGRDEMTVEHEDVEVQLVQQGT